MGIAETVASGSLILAMILAFAAGVVSFASPCVLPLAPGYLSYVTGLTGAEIAGEERGGTTTVAVKSRVLLGSVLFVVGFSVVFVSYGLLFGGLGSLLLEYQAIISRVLGVIVIVMGLSFMGVIPGMQREWRMHRMPSYSVWGAPVLGVLFGLGWTPCIGPVLGTILTIAASEQDVLRGAGLLAVYSAGLGIPFLLAAAGVGTFMGFMSGFRKHLGLVEKVAGALLVLSGLMFITGGVQAVSYWLIERFPVLLNLG